MSTENAQHETAVTAPTDDAIEAINISTDWGKQ